VLLVLVAAGIFYLSHQPSLSIVPPLFPHQDKVLHMVEFFCLFVAMFMNRDIYRGPHLFPVLFATGFLYAASDEIHQSFVPGRDCSAGDLAADAAGLAIGIAVCLSYIRKHRDLT
jgi:VanZ family protein